MYPIPPGEHLVENRKCRQCGTDFPITDKDMEFYEKVSPVFRKLSPLPPSKEGDSRIPLSEGDTGGLREEGDTVRYIIPPPTFCPDCRQQRRLAFRNERKLYKRKCDATGREMLSMFSPDSHFRVYSPDEWYAYDFLKEGRGVVWDKPFFEQFASLSRSVPHMGLSVASNQNCDFTNQCGNSKDCYYSFDVGMAEKCLYSNFIDDSTNCVDCSSTHESHHCYDCIDTLRCGHSVGLLRCEDCTYSKRLVDCIGCQFCLECTNLKNKKYYYRNVLYSKEEWEKINAGSQLVSDEWNIFLATQPRKNLSIVASEKCIGDYISYSENIISSFETKEAKNAKYIDRSRVLTDCMDIRGFGNNLEISYECLAAGINSYNLLFSSHCWSDVSRLYYCVYCIHGTKDCFGCIGLQNKQYCILNKQYTKEEYESLVPRIIEKMMTDGEWGEFFPASLSPFGYNETVAQEYFPLSRDSIIPAHAGIQKTGTLDSVTSTEGQKQKINETFLHGPTFNWSDYEAPFPQVEKIIPASKLPESIESIPDDILNWAIECEVSGKPFRIIRQELDFYRKHGIPIPRRHPDVRHMDRMKMRNPRKLYERLCDCPNCLTNNNTSLLSSSVGGSLSPSKEFSTSENDKGTDHFAMNPKTGTRTKKMITTYSPERPERVYCGTCYEKEVVG